MDTTTPGAGPGGVLRLTWVDDHLAHVLDHCDTDKPSGTWTGLACPDHGLPVGTDATPPRCGSCPPAAR